jgi:hypothetical protein
MPPTGDLCLQSFISPPSHNRGQNPWIESAILPPSACPPPAAAVETRVPARPAAAAVWFAPGAADLSHLPEREGFFEDVWHGLTSGEWPRGRRKCHKGGSGDPYYRDWAFALHRDQDKILVEIRNEGFKWFGGDVDGHHVPEFTEVGRRTDIPGAYVIRRIVAQTGRHPLSGQTKGVVVKELRKQAALFNDYIVLNRRVRGVIRADVDRTFLSWEHVYSWLTYLYDEGEIPCLPHAAVCRRNVDGRIENPHFLILLPIGDEVRWDRRCRRRARGLFRAVENGWVRALGADRGGISNSLKIKNPCSPRMLVGIFNQSTFLSLRDMAAVLDCGRFDDRKLAADASGLPLKKSNEIFDEVRAQAWPTVARMADTHDPRYPLWCADRELMFSGMFDMLAPPAVARWSGEKTASAIETVVRYVCRRLADTWDRKRVSAPPDRGVMGLPAEMPIEIKWKKSGQWSSGKRRSETIDAMAAEIDRIELAGRPARRDDLIDTKKWSKASVYRNFDYAVLLSFYQSQPVEGKKERIPIAPNCAEQMELAVASDGSHDRQPIQPNRRQPALSASALPADADQASSAAIIDPCLSIDRDGRQSTAGRQSANSTNPLSCCPVDDNKVKEGEVGHDRTFEPGTTAIAGTQGPSPSLASQLPDNKAAAAWRPRPKDRSGIHHAGRYDRCDQAVSGCCKTAAKGGQSAATVAARHHRTLLQRASGVVVDDDLGCLFRPQSSSGAH